MAKFRIIKSETTNGFGYTQTEYKIQKKFLFWFFDYATKTHYYTLSDWNHRIPERALLDRRVFVFHSEEEAKEHLHKLENPFWEQYKGNLIGRVFQSSTWQDIYINYSHWDYWNCKPGYEYSDTLEGLKHKIDKRQKTTKISVVH